MINCHLNNVSYVNHELSIDLILFFFFFVIPIIKLLAYNKRRN